MKSDWFGLKVTAILCGVIVIGGVVVIFFIGVLADHDAQRARERDCARLVECIDLRVDRSSCDALFPACTEAP